MILLLITFLVQQKLLVNFSRKFSFIDYWKRHESACSAGETVVRSDNNSLVNGSVLELYRSPCFPSKLLINTFANR